MQGGAGACVIYIRITCVTLGKNYPVNGIPSNYFEIAVEVSYSLSFCKAQPRYASLGYPFRNTAAHT